MEIKSTVEEDMTGDMETSATEPTSDGEDEPIIDGESEKVGAEGEVVDHLEISGEAAEELEGEHVEDEQSSKGVKEGEEHVMGEGEELIGEEQQEEDAEGKESEKNEQEVAPPAAEEVEEEEQQYVEEPPPDPNAPYDLSDSKEALREPFELRPDQIAEVEQLWEYFQDYTPAYTDLDNYITEKELVYMLKSLNLMTYTPEQLAELVSYCVRPPHPDGHINYDQFLKMVTIRQREIPVEEELRAALQVFDPEKTGSIDRDNLKDVLAKQGHKMPQKQLDNLIKEVDMSNDGTIGVEDVVGTMCIDLNTEDMQMLRDQVYPPKLPSVTDEQEII